MHQLHVNFEYYEPSWDWIKYYLEKDKVIKFANCEELWGDTPKEFPLFSEIISRNTWKNDGLLAPGIS